MEELYIPLRMVGADENTEIDSDTAIKDYNRLVVIGRPGSGKTMFLKHVTSALARKRFSEVHDNPVPIFLELHRLNTPNLSLEEQLNGELGRNSFPKANKFLQTNLERGSLFLLFDGLDEVNSSERKRVVQDIKDLMTRYPKCRVVVTCRNAVYNHELCDQIDSTLELVEFSDQQIRSYLASWEKDMVRRGKSVEQLMQTLHDLPRIMSLARNPLLLTIIAYLYTDTEFVLPHSRTEFYRKTSDVLLDIWHQEQNNYRVSDKRLVLQHLALSNQDSSRANQNGRAMGFEAVYEQIRAILPKLNLSPDRDTRPMLDEIVERSGLLLKIDGGVNYQFAHLTLQEYFSAAELKDNAMGLFNRFEKDRDVWRETVRLWCGLDIDCSQLLQLLYDYDPATAFLCLADAQRVDLSLSDKIIAKFTADFGTMYSNDEIIRAFGAVASDMRPRGKSVFDFLRKMLSSGGEAQRIAAANALSFTNLPQAAQAMIDVYPYISEIRPALVRMGDVAVPVIRSLAAQGIAEATDDLRDIGTPEAVNSLVDLLWHKDQRVAGCAAWRLAALTPSKKVEESLRDYPLNYDQKRSDCLPWLWIPFGEPSVSSLPFIAGRVAYLMSTISVETAAVKMQNVDPRISIPLCAIELIDQIQIEELKNAVNKALITSQSHQSSNSNRTHGKERFRRLLGIPDKDGAIPLTTGSFNAQSLTDIPDIAATPTFRFLLNALNLATRNRILGCLIADDLRPTRQDWTNIFVTSRIVDPIEGSPFSMLFFLSAFLCTLFLIAAVVFVAAAYKAVGLQGMTFGTTSMIMLIFAAMVVLFGQWSKALNKKDVTQRARLLQEYGYVSVPLALPIGYVIEGGYHLVLDIGRLLSKKGNISNPFATSVRFVREMGTDCYSLALYGLLSLPSALAYFTIPSLLSIIVSHLGVPVPSLFAFWFWLCAWAISVLLWLQGKRRIRAINNPLCGCLDLEIETAPQTGITASLKV